MSLRIEVSRDYYHTPGLVGAVGLEPTAYRFPLLQIFFIPECSGSENLCG